MVDHFDPGANFVVHPQTSLISSIKTLPDYSNPAVVHQKYVVERLSVAQLAGLMGVSKCAVLSNLKRLGIPTRAAHQSHGRPSNPPYGFHFVDGRLVEHAGEKKVIQTIRRMFVDDGMSMNAIAKTLTRKGTPTKTGKALWHHEMVRSILKKQQLA